MDRLKGKVAVITGAAQGIGALMAKAMADEGAKVLVTDVQDTSKAVKAITDAGGIAQGMKVDVTNNDDLKAMVETANGMGGLDIMVNNASIFATLTPKPFFEISDEEFDTIMRVNARGVHQVMRAIVPTMIKAGGGKVINIASGTFYYGPPGLSHYTASKGAVIALTRCHGRELGDKNIQVNAIAPGLTESEGIRNNSGFDMARAPTVGSRSIKREMLPEDLLGTLLYLASSDSNFVTGQTLNVDGGKVNI
ncbi:SDR family oxidoreductase [Celeribacter halophilus]|jgi:NAD(P)-dependent dehydrogenase (short-subunit alcohol dehydrogenase family)|uniref:SDR family NAD(P)-dependent oxidoreductase n=1 Tax=Celeribacter halophilus TaxID=576117 RepID=UPI0026E236DC|nr:SDR family oxidoreductase [Celeribacter halophilus]MDO6725206.1 SDR family oxidoreductase [Celeribacter halophilus]